MGDAALSKPIADDRAQVRADSSGAVCLLMHTVALLAAARALACCARPAGMMRMIACSLLLLASGD